MPRKPVSLPVAPTVQGIISMTPKQLNSLTIPQLKAVTQILASAGNKRLRSFERRGETSPAYQYIAGSTGRGKFSTAGKNNISKLRAEFGRVRTFLTSKTGTVKGWTYVKKQTIETLKKQYGINIDRKKWGELWRAYQKLTELDPSIKQGRIKYAVIENINTRLRANPDLTPDEIAAEISGTISALEETPPDDYDIFTL